MLTNGHDHTKNHVVLHVESPTNPYQFLCSRCENHWCIWFGTRAITIAYQSTLLTVQAFTKPYHRTRPDQTHHVSRMVIAINMHTMITVAVLYVLIVVLFAYAAYLKKLLDR